MGAILNLTIGAVAIGVLLHPTATVTQVTTDGARVEIGVSGFSKDSRFHDLVQALPGYVNQIEQATK